MKSTTDSNSRVTIFTLLSEVRSYCEESRKYSIKAVRQILDVAVRNCTKPTTESNQSFSFFGDWVSRKTRLIKCTNGRWFRSSFDCWRIVSQVYPDDTEAYFQFWKLLEGYCRLDERVVAHWTCEDAPTTTQAPLRCELHQLSPEVGVYCHCYFVDDESALRMRIHNCGFFESAWIAKTMVESEYGVVAIDWKDLP